MVLFGVGVSTVLLLQAAARGVPSPPVFADSYSARVTAVGTSGTQRLNLSVLASTTGKLVKVLTTDGRTGFNSLIVQNKWNRSTNARWFNSTSCHYRCVLPSRFCGTNCPAVYTLQLQEWHILW